MAAHNGLVKVSTSEQQGGRAFPMHPPGPEEFSKLQELLVLTLKREAEAHRKMKHLHEQLMELQAPRPRSLSDGGSLQPGTPDIMLWDSESSQASESSPGSPGSPLTPPASSTTIMVNTDSPKFCKTSSPVSTIEVRKRPYSQANGTPSTTSSELLLTRDCESHLAPSSQDFRGVKQEREKPPPFSSPPVSTPTPPPLTSTKHSSDQAPPSDLPPPPPPPPPRQVQSEDNLTRSTTLERHQRRNRAASSPENKLNGHRGRSNSFIPNWMKRKPRTNSLPKPVQISPTDSFDEIFSRFMDSSNIQKDSLADYIDCHWSEFCKDGACSSDVRQYREAVWDLFQAEIKYLTRFLQPLEQVYKGFLDELHFHGILKIADVDKIFANLSELCELSSGVANDLFKLFKGRASNRIAPNNELVLSFSMFGHKFNPVYQRFCVNFEKQRGLVRALGQLPDFKEYLRVCRMHPAVGKNDLTALLIAPMQHQCRYQLMLEKVLQYTKDKSDKDLLSSAIKAFVVSLKELEANIDENRRSAEMLELQETLCWPTLAQLDSGAYIPESLVPQLSQQLLPGVLASKDRQLVHNGPLKLMDNKLRPPRDVVVFLFTDLLLVTQQNTTSLKKGTKKEPCNQLTRYIVLGHPVFLNLLDVHDIPFHSSHGHLVTLTERNSFQQHITVYSLQTATKEDKVKWLSQLTQAKSLLWHKTISSSNYTESDV